MSLTVGGLPKVCLPFNQGTKLWMSAARTIVTGL